jgi:hypothetical protein
MLKMGQIMKHSVSLLIALSVAAVFFLTGCSQSQQAIQDESVDGVATITADCIVHYYKSNASAYITRQQHGYNPSAGVQCSLLKENYESTGLGQPRLSDLPNSFGTKNLAMAVFYSFCAGGGLLDTGSMAAAENIKIEGRWYTPLTPQWPSDVKLTLLRSLETKRIEKVLLEDEQEGLSWWIDNYNLRYSKEISRRLPRMIDVFDIRNGIASKELMIRFDYKDIKSAQTQVIHYILDELIFFEHCQEKNSIVNVFF